MKLSILERIIILQLLPTESNYLTYKIISNLKSELSFSEEEMNNYEIKKDGDNVTWNPLKESFKEIEISEKAKESIIEGLKKLDSQGKINESIAKVYEKFITV